MSLLWTFQNNLRHFGTYLPTCLPTYLPTYLGVPTPIIPKLHARALLLWKGLLYLGVRRSEIDTFDFLQKGLMSYISTYLLT